MIAHTGDDRVVVTWTAVGDFDAVVSEATRRSYEHHGVNGEHFVGLSVRWDEKNSMSFICTMEYDKETNSV